MSRTYSDLLTSAYGSILVPEGWGETLDHVVTHLEARGAVLVLQEKGLAFEGYSYLSALYRDSDIFVHYNQTYSHYEGPAWARLTEKSAGDTFFDTELGLPVAELDSQPNYLFTTENFGIRRRIAFRLNESRAWFDAIAIAYPAKLDRVSQSVIGNVSEIAPHLARALELSRTFDALKRRYAAVVGALDRFGLGVAIAVPSGEIIVANAEAERILGERDAIWRQNDGRLVCRNADAQDIIKTAIERAGLTAGGQDDLLAAPLDLAQRSTDKPMLIDVAPLRDSGAELDRRFAGAVVFLIDMANPPKLQTGRFATLHGLTPAEADVLAHLVEGLTNRDIAEIRSTSLETVHAQVRGILQKTRCRNRVEVVRLLVKSLPPIL